MFTFIASSNKVTPYFISGYIVCLDYSDTFSIIEATR